jgi:hypothetical protein
LKRNLQDFPWYAILFAAYPVLTLLAHNIGEVEYRVAYRALFASISVSIFAIFILYFLLHDWKKSGILTVLLFFAFFFYGHIFRYMRGMEINGVVIGRHTYFMAAWSALFLGIAWFILKGTWQNALIPVLSTVSVVLIIFPLYQLLSYQYGLWKNKQITPPRISVPGQPSKSLPDIYFIILDMYGRNDVLNEEFGYDDAVFLQQLKDMGFYVASCSQSNYPSTAYSLSATLNADYLNDISDQFTPENTNVSLMWYLIQNSAVKTALQEQGYKIVAFETGYEWTEWQNADVFYALRSSKINNFEDLLLRNSVLSVFSEKGYLSDFLLTSDQRKHDLSLYVLDKLEDVPILPGPKFIFVHLTIPHPPFVMGPNGELDVVAQHYSGNEGYYVEDEYKLGYRNQLAFLNTRLPQVLKTILEKSTQAPIIILQGDHGPRFVAKDKQLDILNAYYFPEPRPELYASLTPVNNFRIIFNTYFGASLPLLPDRSYFNSFERPYEFTEISNDCVSKSN